LTAAQVQAEDPGRFLAVTGPCDLQFPRDHGQHPGYRSEWWYYTGNLESETGERFGFQLTFFRSQISPPGEEVSWPKPASAWRTQQLYLAHAAVTDIDGKTYYHAEAMSRGMDGVAGVRQEVEKTTVFLRSWSAEITADAMKLTAVGTNFSISLDLTPEKAPVLHGDKGYSKKGEDPARASCYYSFTRLAAEGEITIGDRRYAVSGLSWMDHEFSTEPLEPDLVGWDWFSLQLDDGTELMVFLLRRREGGTHPVSSGTFVDKSGKTVHLSSSEFNVDTLDYWDSPNTGGRYPSRWKLTIPALDLDLSITPNLANQEMLTPQSTRVSYWEGSVSVSGKKGRNSVSGSGYVELTGYAEPFDIRL
jgi:predicted secreted hydrolase